MKTRLSNDTSAVKPERGPDGTIAYFVDVETSDPGSRIEANNEDVGKSPMQLKIYGDKDGSFHNFGSYNYTVRAYPVKQGQFIQTKVFHTGGFFTGEDKIPKRIYFDLNAPSSAIEVNAR